MLIYVVRCWRFIANQIVTCDEILKNTKQEKVLGVTLDNKLNFATHLLTVTKNAKKKFNALTWIQKNDYWPKKAYIFFLY